MKSTGNDWSTGSLQECSYVPIKVVTKAILSSDSGGHNVWFWAVTVCGWRCLETVLLDFGGAFRVLVARRTINESKIMAFRTDRMDPILILPTTRSTPVSSQAAIE